MEHDKNTGMLIVMADENLEDQNAVMKAARECQVNHVFTSVYNGNQLMDLLENKSVYATQHKQLPHLLLLEADLPQISGLEVLAKLKSDQRFKNMPVYILTRNKDEETKKKALQLGALDWFDKPLKFDDLQKIVHGICTVVFRQRRG